MHTIENESILIHKVTENNKVEAILKEQLDISGRFSRRLAKANSILLNNSTCSLNKKAKQGDTITLLFEDETDPNIPEDIPLTIVYEDHDLLLVNKQPGIVVHPTKSHSSGTIANGVAWYFEKNHIKKKIRFVNRLDMDTSGIVVIAKNPFGQHQIGLQFEDNTIEKRYLTLVEGVISEDSGIIDKPIDKDETDPIKQTVREDGKPSLTKFKVIERYNNATLVEVQIMTGRNHQIRVHMNYIGHPVLGDTLYNKPSSLIDRQALHSSYLAFHKPRKGEKIEVHAELPLDMQNAIEKLAK